MIDLSRKILYTRPVAGVGAGLIAKNFFGRAHPGRAHPPPRIPVAGGREILVACSLIKKSALRALEILLICFIFFSVLICNTLPTLTNLRPSLAKRGSVYTCFNYHLTPDPFDICILITLYYRTNSMDLGSSLAKYGVDSMMHHQLNKLTDLTRDPTAICIYCQSEFDNCWISAQV